MALGKISRTVLNSDGESGHPCVVLDLSANALDFSPSTVILAVGL